MMPPGIGFSPAGSSGGHGVGSLVANRTRTAVAGLYRYTSCAASACASCRSGVTSSRIQKPRPCVPAMRSEQRQALSSLSWRSRTEIAGILRRSDCQWSPSSNDTQTWVSVAAESNPFCRGSSRIEFAAAPGAMPLSISVHVLPPSCVRKKWGFASSIRIVLAAAYAVRSSKWPASMLKMRVHGLMAGGVTLVQVTPPFMVTWMLPSSVPAQSTRADRGDGARAVIVPNGDAVTPVAYLPADAGTVQVWRARSGLMRVHECAWSADFQTTLVV